MDFVVFVDGNENELQTLLEGRKRMLLRAACGSLGSQQRVHPNDHLYFARKEDRAVVRAKARVTLVYQASALTSALARQLLQKYQDLLRLTPAQQDHWIRKPALDLIGFSWVEEIRPFAVGISPNASSDNWHAVDRIQEALA